MSDHLESLRNEILHLDEELIRLIRIRMEKVQEIARFKKENSLPIRDDSREADVIAHILNQPHEGIDSEKLTVLIHQLLEISRDTQSKVFESMD